MRFNTLGLLALATLTTTTEDDRFPALSEAFKQARSERATEAQRNAVDSIKGLMDRESIIKENWRGEIRRLRSAEETAKAKLLEIDIAEAYAAETSNFVPWTIALGLVHISGDVGLSYVDFERVKNVPAEFREKFLASRRTARVATTS